MLRWSFVREDIPQREICKQLALAIRDEVQDLEALGIRVIQVDEPALREGLPLRRGDKDAYLVWATEAFRLATSGVKDETQIHTHNVCSDFGDMRRLDRQDGRRCHSTWRPAGATWAAGGVPRSRLSSEIGPVLEP